MICAQSVCVAADALGLGSVYIGPVFDRMAAFRRMCRLPKGVVPVVSLAVGYPAARPPQRRRLPPEAVAHREVYREMSDRELLAAYGAKYQGVREEAAPAKLKAFAAACAAVHGGAFARACAKDAEKRGSFNAPQRIFGLHYKADIMLRMTPKHLRMLKAAGLGWAGPAAKAG